MYLIEKVARALDPEAWRTDPPWSWRGIQTKGVTEEALRDKWHNEMGPRRRMSLRQARAAIDVALEEAAKLAEAQEDEKDCASEPFDGGSGTMGYAKACDHIAAALRALKGQCVQSQPTG